MSKVALVSINSNRWGDTEEVGIGYIAAVLEEHNHAVRLFSLSEESSREELNAFRSALQSEHYSLVGFGCSHGSIPIQVYRDVISAAKNANPEIHTTCGGYWATFNTNYVLDNIPELDSVVVGEGENTVLELVKLIDSRKNPDSCTGLQTRTNEYQPRKSISDLDSLPKPIRQFAKHRSAQLVSISTS